MKHGLFLSQGFMLELADIQDPADAYQALRRVAQTADQNGYETAVGGRSSTQHHEHQHMLFECWTTTSALVKDTEAIRIGQMVTYNSYRNPALQAKMASTLDVISGGRFTFGIGAVGIGAGWWEPDYRSYGYEYPEVSGRLYRLDEALQIILAMWTEEKVTFEGKYYQIKGAINQPKGIQRPHIPLLIAGSGENMTLRLVATYGDMCNVSGDLATLEHKFGVLKKHCEAVGRNYEDIHKTAAMTLCIIGETDEEAEKLVPPWAPQVFPGEVHEYGLVGTVDTIRKRLADYEAVGVDELAITFVDALELGTICRYAKEFMG